MWWLGSTAAALLALQWIRLEGGVTGHRKLLALTRDERWTWVELLDYCDAQRSPVVPAGVADRVPRASSALLRKLERVGLLEPELELGEGWRVHDWEQYQPPKDATKAARQARYRAKRGGRVDGAVDSAATSTEPSTETSLARARAGARSVPSRLSRGGTGSLDVAPAALNEQAPAPVDEGPPACPYCGGHPAELVPHLLERHRGELERDSAGAPFSSLEAFAGVVARSAEA
jgi:hypothetical protein